VTDRSVTHATFKAKARWFAGPEEWGPEEFELDSRVGGREVSRGGPQGGPVHTYEARYQPEGAGTRLVLTEQGAYLDGHDTSAQRQHGTGELLDALGAALRQPDGIRRS